MKKFIKRLLLFTSPFLVCILLEIFAFPIDFYNFRVWESLSVRTFKNFLPGPFYPRRTIHKIEEGDMAHHTLHAVKREVVWHTDRFGFRKKESEKKQHDIVILGRSFVVGTGLSQENILSEVLEESLSISVYPYAPYGIKKFSTDERFLQNSPHTIILCNSDGIIKSLKPFSSKKQALRSNKLNEKLFPFFVVLDRITKLTTFRYFARKKINEKITR